MPSYQRYAIYYIPRETEALLNLADDWLGRRTLNQVPYQRISISGISDAMAGDITEQPRHYGFHATLKAPFRLAPKMTRKRLFTAVEQLVQDINPAPRVRLHLDVMDNFLALRPFGDDTALRAIGNACVTELDHLRAPLDKGERAHRLKAPLAPLQIRFLERWGYPYVLGQFRFHMTLSDALPTSKIDSVYDALKAYFGNVLATPLSIDTICIVGDPGAGQPFEALERFTLGVPKLDGAAIIPSQTPLSAHLNS
ncbi:MAG: DUF1045 domain-containing protein [Alphaproteobacteria bacterium]|nr:DUF1045 domain-containing protein [Alphaproteobacteria bacterium]